MAPFFEKPLAPLLEKRHFCGGNGRVARALLDVMLRKAELLGNELSVSYYLKLRNDRYLNALQQADQGDLTPLAQLIAICIFEAIFDDYYSILASTNKLSLLSTLPVPSQRVFDQEERLKMSDAELDDAFSDGLVHLVNLIPQIIPELQK